MGIVCILNLRAIPSTVYSGRCILELRAMPLVVYCGACVHTEIERYAASILYWVLACALELRAMPSVYSGTCFDIEFET